jgi:hypothetical protein
LEAAELVALNALEPALRSRGAIRAAAREPAKSANFRLDIMEILDEPSGHLTFPTLQDALERIAQLERHLAALEARLNIAHTHPSRTDAVEGDNE